MIKIKYEMYWNDYHRRYEDKSFNSMAEFKDWMFGLMNQPYVDADGHKNMWFLDSVLKRPERLDSSCRIDIRPEWGGVAYWIYCVSDNNKVVFSNGKYTNGQCYISDGFKAFLKECQDRRDGKEQAFEFGEIDGYSPEPEKPFTVDLAEKCNETAADIVNNHPVLARMISLMVDFDHRREDVLSKIEELELDVEFSDADIDAIVARVEKGLSNNVGYWDSFWMSVEDGIKEYMKEKAGSLESVLGDAVERSAETSSGVEVKDEPALEN